MLEIDAMSRGRTIVEHGEHESEDDMDAMLSFMIDRSPSLLDSLQPNANTGTEPVLNEEALSGFCSDDLLSVIPPDILSGIIFLWLSIPDLSRLDIAASSRIGRIALLNCLSLSALTHPGSIKAYGNDYIMWLNSRNIRIEYLLGNRAYLSCESIQAVKCNQNNCFSRLSHLDLQNCVKVKECSVLRILESCRELRTLDLSSCFTSNAILVKIAQCLPLLESLSLRGNTKISDTSMIEVARNCPLIHSLDLSYCNKLTERSYIAICQSLNLTYLRLVGCLNMSDNILLKIAINLESLKTLDLDNCSTITLSKLTIALRSMNELEYLYLPPADHVYLDSHDYISLLRNCQQLRLLGLRSILHRNFDEDIMQSFPNIVICRNPSCHQKY